MLSHAGIALVALVIVAAAAGRQQASATLRDGQTVDLGAYRLQLTGISRETRPDRSIVRAALRIDGPGLEQAAAPALSLFATSAGAIATPAIVPGPTVDVYLVLLDVDPVTGAASLRLTVQPFMSWLWVGGLLVAIGGLLALGPRPIPQSDRAAIAEPKGAPTEAAT